MSDCAQEERVVVARADDPWKRVQYDDIQPIDYFMLEDFTEDLLDKLPLPTRIKRVWALLHRKYDLPKSP